jgi:hypothetical protein
MGLGGPWPGRQKSTILPQLWISGDSITSRTLHAPLALLQRLSFIKARTRFAVVLENLISLHMHTQIVMLKEFARGVAIVVCESHPDSCTVTAWRLVGEMKKSH